MSGPLPVHVTVVIPTRNEEAAIVDTIRSVPNDDWCEKLDFLIVDGNSTDRTRELAEEEGASVYLEPRKGYGRAYKTGFAMAPGDVIVTMDADCTYPGEEVPDLVRKLMLCPDYTDLEIGYYLLLQSSYIGMESMIPRAECGYSVSQFSRTRGSDLATMGCLFLKNSRFVLAVTLARRRPRKSVFHTDRELERLKSTPGEMDC